MRVRILVSIGVLLAVVPAVLAGEAVGVADGGEALFRRAFERLMTPAERVKLLERVVKEHADGPWADDALWVLGEAARRQGLTYRVVYYWQLLISRWPVVRLENYTRALDIYRQAPFDGIRRILAFEGTLYTPRPGRLMAGPEANAFVYQNAVAYDPMPLLIWEELGDCYWRLGKPQLAVAAYGKALAAAPAAGRWAGRARERIGRKQDREPPNVEAEGPRAAGTPGPETAAQGAAVQEPPSESEEDSVSPQTETAPGD